MRYDVVIVGARVAGAATALLLARRGLRVLVIDRGRYASDTLSTHALMRGASEQEALASGEISKSELTRAEDWRSITSRGASCVNVPSDAETVTACSAASPCGAHLEREIKRLDA